MSNITDLNERIGTLVATLCPGVAVHKDSMYGDNAPLLLTIKGKVVSADAYKVSDYKEWIPFIMSDFEL